MFFYLRTRQRHMEREKGPLLPWEPLLVFERLRDAFIWFSYIVCRGQDGPFHICSFPCPIQKHLLSFHFLVPFYLHSPTPLKPPMKESTIPSQYSLTNWSHPTCQTPNIILPPKHTHTHTLNLSLYIVPLHPSYLSSQLPIYLSSYVYLGTKYPHY